MRIVSSRSRASSCMCSPRSTADILPYPSYVSADCRALGVPFREYTFGPGTSAVALCRVAATANQARYPLRHCRYPWETE